MRSKTKNLKSREEIAALAGRAFPGLGLAAGEDAVTELKDGWFNAAYRVGLEGGREVILKIAPPAGAEVMRYERDIMTTEVESMRLARTNPRIPVPEIFLYDRSRELCDSNYFFMEKVDGDNLEHVKASLSPGELEALEGQVGVVIREVNGFRGDYFGYPGNPDLRDATWRGAFLKMIDALLDDAADKDARFDFGYDEIRAAVARHAPALDEVREPCLVHWDAWNPNLFVRNGRVAGIIDFERALWAEPLMEAQFRPIYGPLGPAARAGYGKTEFTASEERRCQLYSLHLALTMNVECHYRNYDTDDVFNFSRGYLAETMAWLTGH